MKALPQSIAQWMPLPYRCLGTDGFGLSEDRQVLRDHFEVNAYHIAATALQTLSSEGMIEPEELQKLLALLPLSGKRSLAPTELGDQ
jgi:pyruvate dehydrogenase E1 component